MKKRKSVVLVKKVLSLLLVTVLILSCCGCKVKGTPSAQNDEPVSFSEFADMLAEALDIDLTAYNMSADNENQGLSWLEELEIVGYNENSEQKTSISVKEISEIFDKLLERNFFVKDESLFGTSAIFGDENEENTLVSHSFAKDIVNRFKTSLGKADAKFEFSTEYESFLSADINIDKSPDNPDIIPIENAEEFVQFINEMPIEKVEYAGAKPSWYDAPVFDREYNMNRLCNLIIDNDNNSHTLFIDKNLQKIVYNEYAYTVPKGYLDKIGKIVNDNINS